MTHDPRIEDAAAAFLAAYDGTHASVWGAIQAAIDAADAAEVHKAELAMARTDADQLRMALRAAERERDELKRVIDLYHAEAVDKTNMLVEAERERDEARIDFVTEVGKSAKFLHRAEAAERQLALAAEALRPFATALERYRLAEHDMIYLWNEQFARMNVMPKQFFDRARAAYAEITRVASEDATLRFDEPASTPQSGEETAKKVVGPAGLEPATRPL